MAIYIFPIFCFGLVITGIVFLGIQQAADLAKTLAAQRNETKPLSKRPQFVPAGQASVPVIAPSSGGCS
jgi:hypothetical protein